MKRLVGLAVLVALAGCATILRDEPIHYDFSSRAAVSPGYPVDYFIPPLGYDLLANLKYSERRRSDRASDVSRIEVNEHLFAWEGSEEGDLLTLYQLRVDPRSELFPLRDTQGHEFAGGQRISYWYDWGRYSDMVFDHMPDPQIKHECVLVTHLAMTAPSKRYRSIASMYEGVDCDKGGSWTSSDLRDKRERALWSFKLKR